jgi:hypothetical protein
MAKMTRRRKIWNMKGCSSRKMRGGCGQCLGGGQMGGSRRRRRRGGCGSICAAAAPLLLLGGKRRGKKSCGCNKIPFFTGGSPAFVGAPITPTTGGNYYKLNPETNNPNDPSVIMANRNNPAPLHSAFGFKGGRGKKSKKVKRGGGFNIIPQDLVNLGRLFTYNAGSSYNAIHGFKPPVNPMPYKDQMTQMFGK